MRCLCVVLLLLLLLLLLHLPIVFASVLPSSLGQRVCVASSFTELSVSDQEVLWEWVHSTLECPSSDSLVSVSPAVSGSGLSVGEKESPRSDDESFAGVHCRGVCEDVAVSPTPEDRALSPCDDSQKAALWDMYESCGGSTWTLIPVWDRTTHFCSWGGVECDSSTQTVVEELSFDGVGFECDRTPDVRSLVNLTHLDLSRNRMPSLLEWVVDQLPNLVTLDASLNRITTLPESIGQELPRLEELNIRSNCLTTLPLSMAQLVHLRELDLSSNQFETVPECIVQLPRLQRLYLSSNQLTSVPTTLGHLTRLEYLDLSWNELTTLPASIGELTRLEELNLQSNQLTSVPTSIGKLTRLEKLNLQSNQLTTPPASIGELTRLEELNLAFNKLTSIPESMSHLTRLTVLNLNSNHLTSLPESIVKLVHLTTLSIVVNRLTRLPPGIGLLTHLRHMSLSSNQLTSLPEQMGDLTNLETLDLSSNQLTTLPEFMGNMNSLQILYFGSNNAVALPDAIGHLSDLIQLHLSGNQLTTLPETMSQLTKLEALDISSNMISVLPDCLKTLSSLETLFLSRNKLTTLPEWLGQLSRLYWLDVASNDLVSIPESIGDLENLIHLFLSSNHLTTLPDTIRGLKTLHMLDIGSNQLVHLPDSLDGMTRLDQFNISLNNLTALPDSIGGMQNLQHLYAFSNALTELPSALGHLAHLIELDIHENDLVVLPEASLKGMISLKRLDASSNHLTYAKLSSSSLKEADLHGNHLTRVGVDTVPSLLWLDVSENLLYSFYVVSNAISWLDVSNNLLTNTVFLKNMDSLVTVDISNNPLESGQRLVGVHHLQSLTARNCLHGDLPSLEIERMPTLSFVDLSDNPGLTGVIPDALEQLVHLRVLRLRNTSLSSVVDARCESPDPHACVPSFLDPGPLVTRTHDRPFSCYEPRPPTHSVHSSLLLEIDWDQYFRKQLCRCHGGHIGRLGECFLCPEHSSCPGGENQTVMIPEDGYWAPVCGIIPDPKQLETACPHSSSWQEGLLSVCPLPSRDVCAPPLASSSSSSSSSSTSSTSYATWRACQHGYTGRLCTTCSDGFTKWGNRCHECTSEVGFGILISVLVLCLLFYAYSAPTSTGTVKTLFLFVQVLPLLPRFGISLPLLLGGISSVSSSFSLSLPGFSCVWSGYDYLASFWGGLLELLSLIVLVCLIYASGMVVSVFSGSNLLGGRTAWRDRSLRAILFLVTISYLPLSSTILSALRCERDSCLGRQYFVSAPDVSCETRGAMSVRVTAGVLVAVYVVGLPVLLGIVLYRRRRHLYNGEGHALPYLSLLYECYTPSYWWWENVMTGQRLVIAVCVGLLPMESGLMPLFLFVFLAMSAELQRRVQPYACTRENRYHLMTFLLLCVNIVSVLCIGLSEEHWSRVMISVSVVVIDLVWFVVLCISSVGQTARRLFKVSPFLQLELHEPLSSHVLS